MIIPNVPMGPLVTESENPTTEWKMFFSQLVQGMQKSLSNEGFEIPQLSTSDIAKLTASNNGTQIYNLTTDNPMVMKAGTFKNILTS